MKAAILYGKEDIRIEEIVPAELQSGEVRIRIEAALTCGTDLKVFKRGYHAKMIVPPAVFGHELAGTIEEVRPAEQDVHWADWRVGERVAVANSAPCGSCLHCHVGQENLCDDLLFLNGAYTESIVVPARIVQKNLLRLKPGTTFRDAALVEPLGCVVLGVEETALCAREHVLVLGAGPIGLMFVALARHVGCDVTVAGRGVARLDAALRLGARAVIDVSGDGDLVHKVLRESPSAHDVVIEAVGTPGTWEAAIQLVRKGGRINLFGGCPSGTKVQLDTSIIHYSNLTLRASFHHTPRTIRHALELIESGIVDSRDLVNGECKLAQLPALFRSMAEGNRAIKTLIRVRE